MREPAGRRRRLFNVSANPDSLLRRLSLFIAVLAAVPIGLPVAAQTGVDVSGTAGIDGWLDPDEPFSVRVSIESDVLFDGVIEASMGGVDITTPAQVPAGTSKTYEVRMPPPTGQTLRVTLRDQDDTQVASTTVSTRTPADEVLVGIGPGTDPSVFDRLNTPIVQRPLVGLSIDAAETPLGLFDHLVVALPDVGTSVIDWAHRGGTLVTDGVPDTEVLSLSLEDGTEAYSLGDGLVLVVDDLSDPESYLRFLLAGDLDSGRRDPWQSPDQALTEAASNSGSGGLPELPWLLAAIAGYAVVVGPVNFFVLHRMGRRDFAWVTIPVISALALGSFWVVGRERLEDVSLSHATVVFGGDRPQSRSSMVLAVGSPGRYELAFDDRMVVYPSVVGNNFDEFGRPVAVGGADVVGSVARFDLEQLGFAAASAIGDADMDLLPLVTVGPDGESLVVENGTEYEFWAWGISNGSVVSAEREPLIAGATATSRFRNVDQGAAFREPGFGMNVGDAIVGELQLFNDDRGWRILSPLGRAAQFGFDETPELFWFGFTEDFDPEISLDGRAADPTGTTLVIVPVTQSDVDSGSEPGRLIDIGNGFIEPGGGPADVFVSSDEMWLRFDLPFGSSPTEIAFVDQFGMRPGSFELWDWGTSELEPIGVGDAVDERFVDPAGRIVMRVGAAGAAGLGDEGFVEIPMSPRSVSIGWSSG